MNDLDIKISALRPGDEISGIFALRSKRLLPYRGNSGFYLGLTLIDRTGQVEGRVWDRAEEVNGCCRAGDVVRVSGRVNEYNGAVQINITALEKCPEELVVPENFIPSTGTTSREVRETWLKIAHTIQNQDLKELLLLMGKDQKLIEAVARCPAAKRNHHAVLGGLWQHSLGVVSAAEGISPAYPEVDRDLLVTGALLHDIGKIEEYRIGADIDFTDAGRLLGHIVLGVGIVDRYISRLQSFSEILRIKLLHMLVSHHGKYEWQSPKKPKFVEAELLHQLDMIDAQVNMFNEAAAGRENEEDSWSSWVKPLERQVFCD